MAYDTLQTHKTLALTPPLNTLQTKKIKFPLPHRIIKTPKAYKTTCVAASRLPSCRHLRPFAHTDAALADPLSLIQTM